MIPKYNPNTCICQTGVDKLHVGVGGTVGYGILRDFLV